MKRLFQIEDKYFESKMAAKQYRDKHGGHVSVGPDHDDHDAPLKTHEGSKGHRQGQGPGDGYKKRRR